MITFKIIGERIRKERELLKLSQKNISDLLEEKGVSLSRETISKIETGDRPINVLEIKSISEVLNIKPDDLIKDEEEEEKDLVSLFRDRLESSPTVLSEVREIQCFVKDIIAQKKIDSGDLVIKKFKTAWR